MPYIPPQDRPNVINEHEYFSPGKLNFFISDAIDTYIHAKGLNYDTLNTVVGVLECAKLELYRRVAAPYEDKKKEENGEVYLCLKN